MLFGRAVEVKKVTGGKRPVTEVKTLSGRKQPVTPTTKVPGITLTSVSITPTTLETKKTLPASAPTRRFYNWNPINEPYHRPGYSYIPVPYVPPKEITLDYGTAIKTKAEDKKETVAICRIGSAHVREALNNQDQLLIMEDGRIKLVLDGCGSCDKSELGVKTFILRFQKKANITDANFESTVDEIFLELASFFGEDDESIINTLSFTILACFEKTDEFVVFWCGDGYIISDNGHEIELIDLDETHDNCPDYYMVNLITDKDKLRKNKEGIKLKKRSFPKGEYKNVGVATDGIRGIKVLETQDRYKFLYQLADRNQAQVSAIIGKSPNAFEDDVTICF